MGNALIEIYPVVCITITLRQICFLYVYKYYDATANQPDPHKQLNKFGQMKKMVTKVSTGTAAPFGPNVAPPMCGCVIYQIYSFINFDH